MIREFLRRLAYYFHRRRFEEELDEEMRHHRARSAFSGAGRWSKYRDLQLHGCDFAALAAGERSGISGDPELARQSVLAVRPGTQAAGGFRCPKHRRECP